MPLHISTIGTRIASILTVSLCYVTVMGFPIFLPPAF